MRSRLLFPSAASLLHSLVAIGLSESAGVKMAQAVKPFNKEPRPEGKATPEQQAIRGPKRGKGTRRSRKKGG